MSPLLILCLTQGLMCHEALCVGNRVAPRRPDITYGGLPPKPGYERDHIIPLCLGGTDTLDNLQYQPNPQAYTKNGLERKSCEFYCKGWIDLNAARAQFYREYSN